MKNIISFFSLLFILFSPLSAQNSFFTLDEAFVIKAVTVDNKAIINFSLAKDIYVYSDQVSVKIKENKNVTSGPFSLPLGHDHDGEIVYFNAQNLEIPLLKRVEGSGLVDYTLIVNYQGCSDKGLCYEPICQSCL